MLVTKDARIFCAAAFSACLNLGLEIVAEFLGPRAAVSCARIMLIDVNRTAQLPYANLQDQIQHGDDLVLRAQTILLSNLKRAPDLERLADRLLVTSRTLARRFKRAIGETPLGFFKTFGSNVPSACWKQQMLALIGSRIVSGMKTRVRSAGCLCVRPEFHLATIAAGLGYARIRT